MPLSKFRRGVVVVMMLAAASGIWAKQDIERIIYVVEGEGPRITDVLSPDDRLVILRKTISHPSYRTVTPSLDEEIERLQSTANAIVLLEVWRVEPKFAPTGDWIRTAVHGAVKDVVRRAKYPLGDGTAVDFEHTMAGTFELATRLSRPIVIRSCEQVRRT